MTAMTSPSWARVRGPLAPYAGGFRVELERLGYTPLTAATHVRLVAHLGCVRGGSVPAAAEVGQADGDRVAVPARLPARGGPDRPAAGGALAGRVDAVRPAQGAGR